MFNPGYIGGKGSQGTYSKIIGQMRPHKVYIEPFFGSGAVFWHKALAQTSYAVDTSEPVIKKLQREIDNGVFAKTVVAYQCDALQFLGNAVWTSEAVVYLDPPYMLETRQRRLYYANEPEETDPEFHQKLLRLIKSLCCDVLISGYPSDLYNHELKNWRCIKYKARTRASTVTECLWCNFPEPTELHDWRFAGENFRQRLSYKRLAARYLARFDRMTPKKRGYVLNEIKALAMATNAESNDRAGRNVIVDAAGHGPEYRRPTPEMTIADPRASSGAGPRTP